METIQLLGGLSVVVGILMTVAVPILTWVLLKFLKPNMSLKNWKTFVSAVETAYQTVEDLSKKTDTVVDDKLAEGLKILSQNLGRSLSTKEKDKAIKLFSRIAKRLKDK